MEEGITRQRDWRKAFTADLIPGLTTAAVVVPKALAYATIAQLPVQAGLFAALVPMVVYAVLGTSRLLSVSTTTPIAILCATAIGEALRDGPGARPAHRRGDTLRARRPDAHRRARPAPGFPGQFHFGAGADRIQGRRGLRHRRRPGAQAARHPYSQRGLLPRRVLDRRTRAGTLVDHPRRRRWERLPSSFSPSASCRSRRHRCSPWPWASPPRPSSDWRRQG